MGCMNRFTQEDVDSVMVASQTQGIPHRSFSKGDTCTLVRIEEELINESETRLIYGFTTGEVSFDISHVGLAQALQNDEIDISR